MVSIYAQDAIHFQKIIDENGQWLKKEINTSINNNIWQHMVEKGKNEALEDSLLSQFNISANFIAMPSFPQPEGPEKRYALPTLFDLAIFVRVSQTFDWDTRILLSSIF